MKAKIDGKIIEYNTLKLYCGNDKNGKELYEGDNVKKYEEGIEGVKNLFKGNITGLESQDGFTMLVNSSLWEGYEGYWNYATCKKYDGYGDINDYSEYEFYIANEDE